MSNSDSENSTANSGPKDLFKCCHCDKAFASSQALRDLQNAHRVVRNVIEAHTNNFRHIAEAGPSAAAAAVAGEVRQVNAGGAYYHQILYPTAGLMAVACGDYFDAQPNGMIRAEDHEPNKAPEGIVNVTRDFLGEWKYNSTNSVGYGAAAESERSSERTLTDPILRVGHGGFAPEGARDDGEEEEEVTSEKTEELSLELKLGF
ncbi:unnamed protein product [Prunus armeniaca]|uniref:C2H2-type domain-containing protein n=1 Tax=Prunus armeniaca TaxID=36596 RepID=A0A6J5Y1B9_PRUAR|nr:unnamed protein product [Prunus armeniaca]